MTPARIIIHCSASPRHYTREHVDEWHRERGWEGIGYHYVIQAGGVVRKGRRDDENGAHALRYNTKSLGVCVMCNPAEGYPESQEQWRALVYLVSDLCLAYGMNHGMVLGHCEVDPDRKPDCPGFSMAALRDEVKARLEAARG